jgi:hypothetical protein
MIAHYSSFNAQDNYADRWKKPICERRGISATVLVVARALRNPGTGASFANNGPIGPFIGIGCAGLERLSTTERKHLNSGQMYFRWHRHYRHRASSIGFAKHRERVLLNHEDLRP